MPELIFREVDRQEYTGNNCIFSAGHVDGHEVDTIYLRMVKDGEEPTTLLLRVDEAARIAALLTNTIWSQTVPVACPTPDGI